MVAKWMDVEISNWLSEWMNESVIHSECGYIFLLWQKTNFWSYSRDVGGCNSKLSLINPIQPSRDHLLLVQCGIPRLSVRLSPQPSSIHLNLHRWSTPRKQALLRWVTLSLCPVAAIVLITALPWHFLLHCVLLPSLPGLPCPSLLHNWLPFLSLFPALPQEFPEAPYSPSVLSLLQLCSALAMITTSGVRPGAGASV